MTAKEFGFLADAIKTYFPRDNVLPTENAMRLWYSELKDIPYQLAYTALRKYVSTNKFAPTIADIREQVAELNGQSRDDLNETAAWSLVLKAICRSTYYSDEEFCKLPKIVQRVIGNPSRLREMAMDENFNHGVESSNFIKQFRIEKQRERERNKLSPDVLKLMRPLNNSRIEDNQNELSIEEQRIIAEENAKPAPEDFMKNVMEVLKIGKSGKTQARTRQN